MINVFRKGARNLVGWCVVSGPSRFRWVPKSIAALARKWGPYMTRDPCSLACVEVARLDMAFAGAAVGVSDPHVFLEVDGQGYDVEVIRGRDPNSRGVGASQ